MATPTDGADGRGEGEQQVSTSRRPAVGGAPVPSPRAHAGPSTFARVGAALILVACVPIAAGVLLPWMIRVAVPLTVSGPPASTVAVGPITAGDPGTIVCLSLALVIAPLALAVGGLTRILRGRSLVPLSLLCVLAFTGLVCTLFFAGFFYVIAFGHLFTITRGPPTSAETVSIGSGFWLSLAGYTLALLGSTLLYNATPHER